MLFLKEPPFCGGSSVSSDLVLMACFFQQVIKVVA